MNGKKKNRKKKADIRQTISERRIHSIARNYLIFFSKKIHMCTLKLWFLEGRFQIYIHECRFPC